MKKKMLTILGASCLAIASAATFAGCFGDDDDRAYGKAEYSKAFASVSETIKPETQAGELASTYPDEDYWTSSNDQDALLVARFSLLASEICKDENFKLTEKPFLTTATVMPGVTVDLKMQFEQVDDDIRFQVIMTDDIDNMSYFQYINVVVDYDFEEEKLEEFEVDYLTNQTGSEIYHFTEYEDNTIMWLKPTTESYTTAKGKAATSKGKFEAKEHTSSTLDVTEHYTTAMSLI